MTDYLINLKLFIKNRGIINVVFLFIFQFEVYTISTMEAKSSFPELVNQCFILKKKEDCIELLIQLEALQLQELARENYSCQTRLLGLQSHVIMLMQGLTKRVSYQSILNEVKEYCYNF